MFNSGEGTFNSAKVSESSTRHVRAVSVVLYFRIPLFC